jgi:hypothetical protein
MPSPPLARFADTQAVLGSLTHVSERYTSADGARYLNRPEVDESVGRDRRKACYFCAGEFFGALTSRRSEAPLPHSFSDGASDDIHFRL